MEPLAVSEHEDLLSIGFYPDYEVTCARCGKVGMASKFMIEEGDEWECPPCWERCEAKERADSANEPR